MQNLSPEGLRQNLSPEGLRIVADVAQRHGVSLDAVDACSAHSLKAMDARRNSTIPISAEWDSGLKAE